MSGFGGLAWKTPTKVRLCLVEAIVLLAILCVVG